MFRRFVERPILSGAIAALILLAGFAALPTLPIAQYPQITPPTVQVSATYIGADAATVEAAVTTPLEEAINGVQGMRYLSSTSTNSGSSTITITFDPSRDVDIAAVDVQNRIQSAEGQLPASVIQSGVSITKTSGNFVMAIAFTSQRHESLLSLSNFLDRNVRDRLLRINGVNNAQIFGERRYAMRIWLDPGKLQFYGLGPSDVTTAVANQNVQVPAGQVGAPPAPVNQLRTVNVHVPGQLADAKAFGEIIVKHGADGSVVRLSQVARVELGAQDYSSNLFYNGSATLGMGIIQNTDANALAVSSAVRQTLAQLRSTLPAGVSYAIPYDSTLFVSESLREVLITLVIAVLLVCAVIYLFLQDLRTTAIPVITIPVSLIGTFAFVKMFNFSINSLVLFGVTLATGLVVDDAIVVIENISRISGEGKSGDRRASAVTGLGQIASAVVATSLVLLAVFIPAGFIPGTTGAIYKQFALTIAFSITLSLVMALTLTPALAALFGHGRRPNFFLFRWFNVGLERLHELYGRALHGIVRLRYLVAAGLVLVLVLTFFLFEVTPTGFIPDEDQGVIFATIQASEGASLNVVDKVIAQLDRAALHNPNVSAVFGVAGFSFAGAAPNQGIAFIALKPWAQRKTAQDSAAGIIASLYPQLGAITSAQVLLFNPPAIPGLGVTGGFNFELEDYGSGPLAGLAGAAGKLIGAANQNPNLSFVYTQFRPSGPEVEADVDRAAAEQLGVSVPSVFSDLSTAFGSTYVNNFTYDNRTYRVYVQSAAPYRATASDIAQLAIPNVSANATDPGATTSSASTTPTAPTTATIGTTGTSSIGSGTATVPLASLVHISNRQSPPVITHYDLYRSVEISGNAAPGHSSGQAIAAMQQLESRLLPSQYHYQWSGISLEETQSGSTTLAIFVLALLVVYLVLAALYESLGDPLVILLSVPAALLGALGALHLRGLTSDVYAQVGFVMLIGLSAKNAILIVQFAKQRRAEGKAADEAVIEAAQTRLRPILMTSFAFIFGLLPLVFATGAGAAARVSLGTAVVGGMLVSTILNLIVIPAMYLIVESLGDRLRRLGRGRSHAAAADAPT